MNIITMIYILAFAVVLLSNDAKSDCSCFPAAATGAAIYDHSNSHVYYDGATITYNLDGTIGHTDGTEIPIGNGLNPNYPSFRINVVDHINNDTATIYNFCFRTGAYLDRPATGHYNAGTVIATPNCARFPNATYVDCCHCCCGDSSTDFITTGVNSIDITDPVSCTERSSTEPGGD